MQHGVRSREKSGAVICREDEGCGGSWPRENAKANKALRILFPSHGSFKRRELRKFLPLFALSGLKPRFVVRIAALASDRTVLEQLIANGKTPQKLVQPEASLHSLCRTLSSELASDKLY